MALKNSIQPLLAQDFDTSTLILGTYQAMNPAGIEHPAVRLCFSNNSDSVVFVSYDGVSDHEIILADVVFPIPFQSLKAPTNDVAMMRKGTVIYVRGLPTAGTIYMTGYYIHPGN